MNQCSGLITVTLLLTFSGAPLGFAQPTAGPRNLSASGQASHDDEKETVGEISDDVAQVRFQKLGYKNIGPWNRNGDYLESIATKDGKSWQLRLQVRTGAREEKPVLATR